MIYMASTSISPDKTAAEIMALLGKKGAVRIVTEYSQGEITAISFAIDLQGKLVPFRLPIKWEKCLAAMKRDRETPHRFCNEHQAKRVAWRQVLRWLQAQFALIDTGMAEFAEVMLPYVQVSLEHTFYEQIAAEHFMMLPEKT